MRLLLPTPVPTTSPPPAFETVREVTARVGKSVRVPSPSEQVMRAASLCCQAGGRTRTGSECLACARIISIKPSRGRAFVTVRCLWTEHDRVDDVMTLVTAATTVRESDTLGRADDLAARHGVHHVLVLDAAGVVVGVVCRCVLAERGSPAGLLPVADRVVRWMWTIPPGTSLGAVAAAMERIGTDILLVADGDQLRGVVTARDLGLDAPEHISP